MASNTPLKIALVLDDSLDKTGGVQEYILSIGEWLAAEGHNVHYLVGATTRTDIPNVHSLSKNIGVRFNGNRMSIPLPASKRRIKELLEREQFDVLHIQTPYSPWLAHRLIMAAPTTTAVIGTFHIVAYSRLVTLATKALAFWTRKSVKRFDLMMSVSSAAVSYAKQTYGISSVVIPNAIDYYRFHQAAPSIKTEALRIVFLGRLVERKGCQYLLQATQKLQSVAGLPPYTVIVGGKGPLDGSLKTYVRSNGLEKVVEFVGYVSEEDKPGFYASADISVFPSTGGESFGIVLIEAMASGRSVVLAGKNSGYSTVMEPQPELLFDAKDSQQLADKLAELLLNADRRQSLSSWGMEYSRNFDVDRIGKLIMVEYEQALRKRRKL
jgi:phosphatidylinositol alpha-mannosyltransferase